MDTCKCCRGAHPRRRMAMYMTISFCKQCTGLMLHLSALRSQRRILPLPKLVHRYGFNHVVWMLKNTTEEKPLELYLLTIVAYLNPDKDIWSLYRGNPQTGYWVGKLWNFQKTSLCLSLYSEEL